MKVKNNRKVILGYPSLIFLASSLIITTTLFSSRTVFATQEETTKSKSDIIEIQKRKNIRIVYDVSRNDQAAGIGKALYYARGLFEAYKDMGVTPKDLKISIVVRGAAAYWLLKPEAYQMHVSDIFAFNPNEKVVADLIELGVSVEICNITMKSKGWKPEDILPDVKRVHDGYTRVIDLQQQGYAHLVSPGDSYEFC